MLAEAVLPTTISLGGAAFRFEKGETIWISRSRKFTLAGLDRLLEATPWRRGATWTDEERPYALCLLRHA